MARIPIVVKFEGGEAEDNRLPAYEGSESIRGITRSLIIPVNYLVEQRVRHQQFKFDDFDLVITATRPGSVEFVYELIFSPAALVVIGGVATACGQGVKEFITDFTKSTLNRAIGKSATPAIEEAEAEGALKSGDLGALVEAIEPALKSAHRSINNGSQKIIIIQGDNNTVNFDARSKKYVNSSSLDKAIRTKLFSVSSYNANSSYGRAFDVDEGRTVPFILESDVDIKTVDAIMSSMRHYAFRRFDNGGQSLVAFKYRAILSPDERVKKLIVTKARNEIIDL